MQPKQTHILAR